MAIELQLGETLLKAIQRDPRNLSQIARAAGIHRGILTRFVNGDRRQLRLTTASRLCASLNLQLTPRRRPARKGA